MSVDSVIQSGRLLVRGSQDWENREIQRMFLGCCCLSPGTVEDAIKYEKTLKKRIHRRHIVRR